MNYCVLTIAPFMAFNISAIAIAQIPFPTPNVSGDYSTNETPIKGTVPKGSKLMTGSLWQVVSPGLNCRRSAGTNHPIVRQFKRGDVLQAEVVRGGSDEVLRNTKDASGKLWMWVRAKTFKLDDTCYVRANRRYIQPMTKISVDRK